MEPQILALSVIGILIVLVILYIMMTALPSGITEGGTYVCKDTGAIYKIINKKKCHYKTFDSYSASGVVAIPVDCATLSKVSDGNDL